MLNCVENWFLYFLLFFWWVLNSSGSNCQTGACNGGLVCNDAGITSHALLSEYGLGTDGRIYWNRQSESISISILSLDSWPGFLKCSSSWFDFTFYKIVSYVGGVINIPTRLIGPDNQQVYCASGNCPTDQAFEKSDDFGAIRNSAQGGSYTHHFCG